MVRCRAQRWQNDEGMSVHSRGEFDEDPFIFLIDNETVVHCYFCGVFGAVEFPELLGIEVGDSSEGNVHGDDLVEGEGGSGTGVRFSEPHRYVADAGLDEVAGN